jgi:hypothetical protein
MKTKKISKQVIIILMFLVTLTGFNNLQAQSFDAKDMDGMWERNDGVRISINGTAVFAEGSRALIFAVGNSGWPESVIQYNYKFQNIKHKGSNTWMASNFAFSKSKNTFISSGNSSLIMSKDKSNFTCDGYTYYRKSLVH